MKKNNITNAEFSGLFWGEGYCAVVKYHSKRKYKDKIYDYHLYRPQMSIAQREDNKEIVLWVQKNYGGNIWLNKTNKPNQHNSYHWTTSNSKLCLKICNILLKSSINARKRKSVEIVKKYCEWLIKKGNSRKNTEKEKRQAEKWYQECKRNHKFSKSI